MPNDNKTKSMTEFAETIGKSVNSMIPKFDLSKALIPDISRYDISPSLDLIKPVPNPLIAQNEELISEIKRLNNSFDAMNVKIRDLEEKAVFSDRKNVRRQWTIAITSTLVGVIAGFAITFLI